MLLYIGPDKVLLCIEEMGRIAKRAVILLEMHRDGTGLNGFYKRNSWVADYRKLCKQLSLHIKVTRMLVEKDKRANSQNMVRLLRCGYINEP